MYVTIEDAYILAKRLKDQSTKIQAIELFGSVLKNGVGHDADLIFIVDDELWREFWTVTSDINPKWPPRLMWLRRYIKNFLPWLDQAFIWKRKQTRQLRASRLIGLDITQLGEHYRPGTIIDVWLMPSNWQSRIAEITTDHNMTIFLNRAAQSFLKIA